MRQQTRKTGARYSGFTLVELLVVVSIIVLLVGIMLPALGAAREAARAATCSSYLRTYGNAAAIFASQDPAGRLTSGAYDFYRDGPVDEIGFVADMINLKIGTPNLMLCPTNRMTLSEKTSDYMGVSSSGSAGGNWASVPSGAYAGGATGTKGTWAYTAATPGSETAAFWNQGYNTNYTATWQFVRGDPLDWPTSGTTWNPSIGPDGTSKTPDDGDGPLSNSHLEVSLAPAAQIPLMGDARPGDAGEAELDASQAANINAYAGEVVARANDVLVEAFTDGISANYSGVSRTWNREAGHEYNDIQPFHSADSDGVGGFANVLFADGHVARVVDETSDGFIGPVFNGTGFDAVTQEVYEEIAGQIYAGPIRGRIVGGGGLVE